MRDKKGPLPHSSKSKHGRLHHWLLSARLSFVCDSRGEGMGTHYANITVTNDRFFITANMIGKAQQALQVQLLQMLGDPSLKILDVHIAATNYLGEMSKEEFYTPPTATAPEADGAPAAPVIPAANDPFQTT